MKVFISWSGETSSKVALILREWLPSVIQTITPYVSSEDIDKGARWSSDIAKELEDSTFGILCVTKENLEAPWLSFEAGALSRTIDKSYVTPFLFDIKRSEVKGPMLQFQSTVFQKDDIKKLVKTLNKACGDDGMTEARLDKSFEVWYPSLENDLNQLKNTSSEVEEETKPDESAHASEILEEILELSRDNQKLLRSPDTQLYENINELKETVERVSEQNNLVYQEKKRLSKYSSIILDEILHMNHGKSPYGFLMTLSLIKDDFPWIYDMGKELLDILKNETNSDKKEHFIRKFREMIEFTCGHPVMRDFSSQSRNSIMIMKELPYVLSRYIDEVTEQY